MVDKATQASPQTKQPADAESQTVSSQPATTNDAAKPTGEIVAQLHDRGSSRSVTQTFSERETSSVIIQTEETLETFNMLGDLIQGWAQEVKQSQLRAERAEKQAYSIAEKYVKLEKAVKTLKKDFREKEMIWRQKNEEQRLKFLSVLSKVSSKLDVVVE